LYFDFAVKCLVVLDIEELLVQPTDACNIFRQIISVDFELIPHIAIFDYVVEDLVNTVYDLFVQLFHYDYLDELLDFMPDLITFLLAHV